jgi:TolB-like protein/tRNA A-37 threonylcarbamoyl transferase component Bud32
MAELLGQLQATLGEGFVVERELARGGMSRVFLVTETRLNRRVVVKVLRSEIAAGTSTERFEREIALCARCQHPHIVPLLNAGHVGALPYFTMPFVEGESLRDRLVRAGSLPVADVVRLLIEISDALNYAHRMGVVHRDIKPENVLVQDGHAVIADFGVAKALDQATGNNASVLATSAGIVLGTPAYMAPEQATGDPGVDHRADLYALGVLGYELLTGKPPFGELMPPALVSAQLTRTPTPVNRTRKDCPPALATLIGRMLAKDADHRPESADAVRQELLRIQSGGNESRGRSRVVIAVAVVLGVALLLVLLLTGDRSIGNKGTGAAPAKSLAVLPFQNIGGDSTTDYFGQGIAEELISALGRLGGLRVASRTSAVAARAASDDLRAIGQRLGVGAVLEGTVQQVGSRVRVSARLMDVTQETQLWSGDYRAELKDVFEVQDTIARAIVAALRVTLTGAERSDPLVERGTRDQEAHDRYLRGRFFLAQRTPAAGRRAIEAFEAALARDSGYALAAAGLADAYALLIPFGGGASREEFAPRARAAARRALALDSTLVEVQTSLGFIAMWIDWDLPEADRRFNRALEINPNHLEVHLYRSWLLAATDRMDQAVASIRTANTLDPLSLIVNARAGVILHFARRYREAVAEYRRALELEPGFPQSRAGLALNLAMLGQCGEALTIQAPLEPLLGTWEVGTMGVVRARCGRPEEARAVLRELEADRANHYVSADGLAAIHAALGDKDAAFRELDRAVRERAFSIPVVRIEPVYDALHSDPRWPALMRAAGLQP